MIEYGNEIRQKQALDVDFPFIAVLPKYKCHTHNHYFTIVNCTLPSEVHFLIDGVVVPIVSLPKTIMVFYILV